MKISEVLKRAYQNVDKTEERDALFWLLLEVFDLSRSEYVINKDKEADELLVNKYVELSDKYTNEKIAVQYLVGYSYFYGRKFFVNKDTLIPRFETEELIFRAIKYLKEYIPNKQEYKILDLGSGSGCIGITIKMEMPNSSVTLVDNSNKALMIVKKNQVYHDVDVKLVLSDWLNDVNERFDLIISNPPYIPVSYEVDSYVNKEPHSALYSGIEGLDSYQEILSTIDKNLAEKALIAFEHGYDQKESLAKLVRKLIKSDKIRQEKDFNDRDRYTFIFR
ncbi:MAG: peptide chain release factor N(5)-glutamine methyltransferase [Acholeplasma sp.]|nr:peptide chain release factor N(5)-glutamine methyltransferase [Acholeplasma sp.]